MRSARHRNQGFTILELILAAALGVVVLGGAYVVYEAGWSTVGRSERRADLQQNARAALDMLVWYIRHAGYQGPSQVENFAKWPNRIVIAAPNFLVIRGDVRTTGSIAAPAPLMDTLFGLQPPGAGACPSPPSAYPLPGCLVTGTNVYTVPTAPTVVAFNAITGLNFNYFDATDTLLLPTPLGNPVAWTAWAPGPTPTAPLPAARPSPSPARRTPPSPARPPPGTL